jgi:hypothetical protein
MFRPPWHLSLQMLASHLFPSQRTVNTALGIDWAGTFLPKHCVGNPGNNTELFVKISRGLYRLK